MNRTSRAAAGAVAVAVLLGLWLLWPKESPPGPEPPPSAASTAPEAPSPLSGGPLPPADAPSAVPAPAPGVAAVPERASAPSPKRIVVEGKVVGLRGEPVENAQVVLLDCGPGTERVPGLAWSAVVRLLDRTCSDWQPTGKDGAFRLEAEPRPVGGVLVSADGYASAEVRDLSFLVDVRGLVLRLESPGDVSGRVFHRPPGTPEGAPSIPIGGATVRLLRRGDPGRWIDLGGVSADAEGVFRLQGWPPGAYALLVEARGFADRIADPVGIPSGDVQVDMSSGVQIAMVPVKGARVDGFVLLPGGTGPAEGAEVRATTWPAGANGRSCSLTATTDTEGRFRMEDLAVPASGIPTELRLEVDAGTRGMGALRVHDWRGGTTEVLTLLPAALATLRGRVVDLTPGEGRRGVPGIGVEGYAEVGDGRDSIVHVTRRTRTGADGTFSLERLPDRGVTLRLAPDETGWEFASGPWIRVPERVEGVPWDVEVEVYPRGSIAGTACLPDGTPAAGARVEAVPGGTAPGAAMADSDGRFVLRRVSTIEFRRGVPLERPIRLRAELPGYLPGLSLPVSLPPGGATDGVVVTLGIALAPLSGKVVDEEGRPLTGVSVRVEPADRSAAARGGFPWVERSTLTGPAGIYRLEAPAGQFSKVIASGPGLDAAASEGVMPGDPVPDVVLRRSAPVEAK